MPDLSKTKSPTSLLVLLAIVFSLLSEQGFAVYCDASGSNYSEYQYIVGVQVGSINNIPTGNDHYADYTSLSTAMLPEVSYPITVTRGNPWDDVYDKCGLWVDWNRDEDFYDVGEEIVMSLGVDPCTFTGTITPPAGAVLGNTRMRIRIVWNEVPQPCGGSNYGEVEDYTINIPSGDYCSALGGCDGLAISRVEFGSIDNGWTGCDGYADYTNLSSSVELGKGHAFTLSYRSSLYPQIRVWVDWNQDYDFNDPDEEFIGLRHNDDYSSLFSATIKTPPDAALGNTRMRIRSYAGYDDFLPCGETYRNGEVEDYTITVIEANDIVFSTYPYYEDFTTGFGLWNPGWDSDFDWVWIRQRWMQASDKYFLRAESDLHSNETAVLQSPAFDIGSLTWPIIRFRCNMQNDSGSLFIDVSNNDGATWNNIWTLPPSPGYGGEYTVDLPTDSQQITIRFRAVMDNDDFDMHYINVGECTVPQSPSNLQEMSKSRFFITWLWDDNSDDEQGFKAYDEFDNHIWTEGRGVYSVAYHTEFSLTANTPYTRRVSSYNHCGENSSPLLTIWTLPESPSVSCDRTINEPTWTIGTVFTFTNNHVFGSGGVEHYHYVWDKNSSYSFTGSESEWSNGTMQLTGDSSGQWYLHVLSHNGTHDDNGTAHLGPYNVGVPDPHSSTIHGFKFHDLNGDGIKDTGEPNLSGWKIYIDANENGQWDDTEVYAITEVNGHYAITNLAADTYVVAEVLQTNWEQTFPGSGTHSVELGIDEIVGNINFGNWMPYGGGDGTAENPYLIYTVEQMQEIGLHQGHWTCFFKLMADINLAGYTGMEFNLIGDDLTTAFSGVFDGNNHTIYNFTYTSTGRDNIGVFSYIDGGNAEIKDLALVNTNINAGTGRNVGALVGRLVNGTISDCYVRGGNVSGDDSVGGLLGRSDGETLTNCYSSGSVSGTGSVGGLLGYNNQGTVSNCGSSGNVSGTYSNIGGLVGDNYLGIITCCTFSGDVVGGTNADNVGGLAGGDTGDVSYCYTNSNVEGDDRVGGLSGLTAGTEPIIYCYSKGTVSGNSDVGGLVGSNSRNISNSCSTSNVSGNDSVGGLAGDNWAASISKCYSAGTVSGNSTIGGLIGYKFSGTVTDSFWDVNSSGLDYSDGGEGKTTADMQTMSTFTGAGWDFVSVWDICEGMNYPKLRCHVPVGDFICPDGVNFFDYSFFAEQWAEQNCAASNDCDGRDLDQLGSVDIKDLRIFANNWLAGL